MVAFPGCVILFCWYLVVSSCCISSISCWAFSTRKKYPGNQPRRPPNRGESNPISTTHAARKVGVQPPANVPARVWKRAWTVGRLVTPLLHWFDPLQPPNSSLNLYCLWWKALSGNDPQSPVFDHYLAFDLLPRGTRYPIKYFRRFFPRLHHANVEIRTAFLDGAVEQCANIHPNRGIRLISFGAGYDVRSIKLRERNVIECAYELDLPEVVEAKTKLLTSRRLQRRRPTVTQSMLPQMVGVNLNRVEDVERALVEIFDNNKDDNCYTVFLFEAVLIYLDEGIPSALLQLCSRLSTNKNASLVFADRLENIPAGDKRIGQSELEELGWKVVEWLPKPGLARHMGRAELLD